MGRGAARRGLGGGRWPGVAVVAAVAWLGGCDTPAGDEVAPFREALPDDEALLYAFPDTESVVVEAEALEIAPAALVGDVSELWLAGRDTTRTVNRALSAFLSPIARLVRATEPTWASDARLVWRGVPAGSLDEDLLVVERAEDGHFEYTLWSRDRIRPLAEWRFRAYGSTTPGAGARRGRGVMWVDLDADRNARSHGKVLALWERAAARREVAIAFYAASPDDAETPARTKSFLFAREADGRGTLAFGPELVDVHDDPARTALEEVRVLTRWTAEGRGRSDAAITGGDVATAGNALLLRTECWRTPDHTTTYEATQGRKRTATGPGPLVLVDEDGERASCGFAEPEAPVLPALGDEPVAPALPPEAADPTP